MKTLFKGLLLGVAVLVFISCSSEESKLKKACEAKYAGACFDLGLLYDDGQGVKQDYQKAAKFYARACDLEFELACFEQG